MKSCRTISKQVKLMNNISCFDPSTYSHKYQQQYKTVWIKLPGSHVPTPALRRPSLTTHFKPASQRPMVCHCPPHFSPSTFAQTLQQPQMDFTRPPLQLTGDAHRTHLQGIHDRQMTGVRVIKKLPMNSNLINIFTQF